MDGTNSVWSGDVTVAASGVHVHYRVATTKRTAHSRLGSIGGRLRSLVGAEPRVLVRALAGVSLVARHGESVGIIGSNGSGKSTLLRMIAGVEVPTAGRVVARSTPVLLGVNAALVPDLSGAQNVQLGCLALGMDPSAAENAMPEILELSGIGDAIHLPMRTYSSGMGARLRFAIATAANPEILLIDEALSTGDAAFRERSEERMRGLLNAAGTVFLVSHAAQTIEEMCTRAVWLHRGRVVLDGPAEETARKYRWWAWNVAKGETATAEKLLKDAFAEGRNVEVRLIDHTYDETVARHARTR